MPTVAETKEAWGVYPALPLMTAEHFREAMVATGFGSPSLADELFSILENGGGISVDDFRVLEVPWPMAHVDALALACGNKLREEREYLEKLEADRKAKEEAEAKAAKKAAKKAAQAGKAAEDSPGKKPAKEPPPPPPRPKALKWYFERCKTIGEMTIHEFPGRF